MAGRLDHGQLMTPELKPRLMAVDVGLTKIGIALNDSLWLGATPLEVMTRTSRKADFAHLCRLLGRHEVASVICGLPVSDHGNGETDRTAYIREWARRWMQAQRHWLEQARPVIFWDERWTTAAARIAQGEAGHSGPEDAVAAALILEDYMRARERSNPRGWGRIDP